MLDEMKGFKDQITVKVLLSNDKVNTDRELAPVDFNSTNKTLMNFNYELDKFFQEIIYGITNWIN